MVAFSAPSNTGGSAITGYTATSNPGNLASAGYLLSPCSVLGLTNGIAYTYTFTFAATNSVGSGLPSAPSNAVTGNDVMIGGFVIQGTVPQTLLIRAVGPNLANFGVPGVLANPTLTLFSGQTEIASNDDWGTASNAAAIQATGLAPVSPLESAILITLQPGAYTAVVSGTGGGTGVGIIEVYAQ